MAEKKLRIREVIVVEGRYDRNTLSQVVDALIFENLKSKSVRLVSTRSGRGVEMDISGFPVFAVWTMVDDQPFVCFEPWQGGATRDSEDDVFEHKNNVVIAAPGDVRSFSYSVRVF